MPEVARWLPVVALLAGCPANPVADCELLNVDCCLADQDCARFYGDEFPYCVNAGSTTGICAECRTSEHCGEGLVCVADASTGGFCCDPKQYDCGPLTDR